MTKHRKLYTLFKHYSSSTWQNCLHIYNVEKCLHVTDFTPHFSTWHDFSLYLPCGDLSPTEHLSCGDTSPHDNLSHGKIFSTWQIFSPQTPFVMFVTNIRYAFFRFQISKWWEHIDKRLLMIPFSHWALPQIKIVYKCLTLANGPKKRTFWKTFKMSHSDVLKYLKRYFVNPASINH